jgi:hypothetical protein
MSDNGRCFEFHENNVSRPNEGYFAHVDSVVDTASDGERDQIGGR